MDGLMLLEAVLALAVVGTIIVLKRGIDKHNQRYDEQHKAQDRQVFGA